MTWKIELTDEAKAELGGLDNSVQKSVAAGLMKLNESPQLRGHSLTGNLAGYRALAVGKKQIRIIYRIERDQVLVVVIAIGHRRNNEVYLEASTRTGDSPSQ
jgi:mRNA interferase RelE/StbE